MALNRWECDEPGCKWNAIGVGGAIGLRAIGWFFEPGNLTNRIGRCFCPAHRPDKAPHKRHADEPMEAEGEPCSWCKAVEEANELQEVIARYLDDFLAPSELAPKLQAALDLALEEFVGKVRSIVTDVCKEGR